MVLAVFVFTNKRDAIYISFTTKAGDLQASAVCCSHLFSFYCFLARIFSNNCSPWRGSKISSRRLVRLIFIKMMLIQIGIFPLNFENFLQQCALYLSMFKCTSYSLSNDLRWRKYGLRSEILYLYIYKERRTSFWL